MRQRPCSISNSAGVKHRTLYSRCLVYDRRLLIAYDSYEKNDISSTNQTYQDEFDISVNHEVNRVPSRLHITKELDIPQLNPLPKILAFVTLVNDFIKVINSLA